MTSDKSAKCLTSWNAAAFLGVVLSTLFVCQSVAWAISPRCQGALTRQLGMHGTSAGGGSGGNGVEPGEVFTFYVTSSAPGQVTTSSGPSGASANNNASYTSVGVEVAYTQSIAPGDTEINFHLTLNPNGAFTVYISCTPAVTAPTNSQILEQTRQTFSKIGAQVSSQAIGDAVGGAIGDAFSGGGTTQFGNGSFRTSFAAIESAQNADAKPSGEVRDAREAFAALGYAKASHLKTPVVQSPWHVWIDGRFTGFEDRSVVGFDGWHSNITGGASYRFADNFLAGMLVGYENSNYSAAALGAPASLRGEGISGGGYLGWKFYDRLRLDGMLTYGRINYGAAAGPVSASFSADRITAMSKLSGRYGFGAFWLEPSAMLTIASEHQDSFVDTAAVLHNTFNFTVGRASTGATIGVPLVWDLCVVTPTFGVFADYRFGDEAIAALFAVPTSNNGWSAHVNGGLSIAMPGNITASATAEYGGLGENIQYWRAKGSLGVKF